MILILPYGNSLRRDDGAGFVLAGILESLLAPAGSETRRIDSHQLEPELALEIAAENVSAVVFIDTRIVSGPSDDLQVHFHRVTPAQIASPGIGHSLDPSVLLAYAGHLFNKNPPAWLITIPGADFDHGEGFGAVTRMALDNAPHILRPFTLELLDSTD